jgi:hypothetical protein
VVNFGWRKGGKLSLARDNQLKYVYEIKGSEYLHTSEIKALVDRGFIGPKKMKNFDHAMQNRIIHDISHFLKSKNNLNTVIGVQWFVPSVFELIALNLKVITQQASSLFNVDFADIIISAQGFVATSNTPTLLHNDYSSALYAYTSGIEFINFHVALTEVNSDSNKLVLFPGTHREIESPYYALHDLITNNIAFNITQAIKALALWESVSFSNVTKPKYETVETAAGKCAIDDSAYAYHSLHKFYMQKYKNSNIEAQYVESKPGEYVILVPSILHSSTYSVQEEMRASIVIRATKIAREDTAVFEQDVLEDIWYKNILRNVYKFFGDNRAEELDKKCETIGEFLGKLPHLERLSIKEIKAILFDDAEISDSVKMSPQLTLREESTLPFIPFSRLIELNCKAGFIIQDDLCSKEYNQLIGLDNQIHDNAEL